jgi:hypothetical protein
MANIDTYLRKLIILRWNLRTLGVKVWIGLTLLYFEFSDGVLLIQ